MTGTGKTVTRADLCEAVYQKVGLSRTESSAFVELVLKEITDCLERGETVKLSSFGSFMVRKKGQRIGRNPKTGNGSADLAAARDGVQAVRDPQAAHQRQSTAAAKAPTEHGRLAEVRVRDRVEQERAFGQGAGRIPHHQRSRRRTRRAAARPAFLGNALHRRSSR